MNKDNIESIYPLTPLQEGILFHANYDVQSSVYIESLSFSITGDLDVPAFKKAWLKVVERHPVLRTFFVWKNRDNPLQIVRKQVDMPWQEFDWHNLTDEDQKEKLKMLLKDDHEKGFDFSKAPLCRFMLVQLGQDSYHFVWSYHHIILDGWSITTVLKDVFALYYSLQAGSLVRLSDSQPFKTYVNWLQSQDLSSAKSYWSERMQGFEKITSINIDGGMSNRVLPQTSYDSQMLSLSKSTSKALGALAKEQQLTLNTLFQGAWALLLSIYSGESDVVFGAAVSGRSIPLSGVESMVGLLIGSLPVRVNISPQKSIISWLEGLQAQQVQALRYEFSSLRDIQAWSQLNRSEGQALFETILSFNNYGFDSIFQEISGDLQISDVSFLEGSHYPLTMLIDPGEQIQVRINFDHSRFDRTTIIRILEHLQVLLERMVTNPSDPLSAFSLLTSSEEQSYLVEYNLTNRDISAHKNIVHLFEEQAKLSPDAVALRIDEQILTYDQLNKKSNQLAHHLIASGIGPEKVVALFLDRSIETIIAILGTLKAGGAYLPLDTSLPAKRLGLMLEETAAPVVLTIQNLVEKLPATNATIIQLDRDWSAIDGELVDDPSTIIEPDHLAYMIYTSGSTGKPKGTLVEHGNLLNYVVWARDFYLQGEKFDFPLFSSLSFDLTITSIYVPLVSGGSIVIYPEVEKANLVVLDVIKDDLVDVIKLTPAHLTLLQTSGISSKRLQKMIVGGEDFKRNLAHSIHELFDGDIEIYNEYGPTEATVGCMIHRFDPLSDVDGSVPIGKPINNAQIYVLNEHLKPVPPGVIGEMCIGGAGVARGYLHRPELTKSKFANNPFKPGTTLYRTGDLARWTPQGQMQFLGRLDHQVKIKGYRVELGEIETNLLEHPDIESAVVTVFQPDISSADKFSQQCVRCGLPNNYPGVTFDSAGVCSTCREFSTLKDRFKPYFKTPVDLQIILDQARQNNGGKYDCMVLYSGGKDSSYMLYQLVKEYGMTPLVFSMDNGYISEEAKENMLRITDHLGVDLVFGQTPHMNAVFVDSLKRHNNVCDGCFKVIYTLSINMAREHGIKYIFTGLTRGQLFETRLSDMFRARIFDVEQIDRTVLDARKAYHRLDDAVNQLLDVAIFEDDKIFDEIHLVDFYRYTDVSLQEMHKYLTQNALWVRPSDTGRSTNCLINDVGIYIHKKERGYHNYALPYSWDVRIGHKTRQETIDELNDDINQKRVQEILGEIGYDEVENKQSKLAAYYVTKNPIKTSLLREHLQRSLPDYMIPTHLIEMEDLPLTKNGKIDRQALPLPESDRMIVDTAFVAPETSVELQLAEIWEDVFHLPEIGIHDNFFELGGDSIMSIQIVTKSRQAGLHFTPRNLFEHQTIAQLAMVVELEQDILGEQGLVNGEIPLTPILNWFFEQKFDQPNYWNQTIWLDVPATIDINSLERALNLLPQQHDVLRSRFFLSPEGSWKQVIKLNNDPITLAKFNLAEIPSDDQDAAMQKQASYLEGTLNIETGTLMKAALFILGPKRKARLLVTCHHLIIDGISWQPLLEDWETAYHQIKRGETVKFPPKTTSFKEWAEKVATYSKSSTLEEELEYWQSGTSSSQKLQKRTNGNGTGSIETFSKALDVVNTNALLHEVHSAYNTNVLDFLVTAWAQAFSDWSGNANASIMVEHHGRETEIIEGVDLSHTVGWFTTHYPVHIHLLETWNPERSIKQVKEQLRRVPNNGFGYGVLRYLRDDIPLPSQATPTVLYNYMGQFERALPTSDLFALAKPLQGSYGPNNHRTHILEVNSYVRHEQLHTNVVFNQAIFGQKSIKALVEGFVDQLELLIAHCLSPDSGGYTPSDFTLADLSDDQFDQISALLNQLDE